MSARPDSDFDGRVRLAVLDEFLREQRPSVDGIAGVLGAPGADVGAAFERLAAGRAFVLVPGTRDLHMAAPFSAIPTDFRVRVGGRACYANCVWDALGIPAMLAAAGRPADASIETTCPDCAAPLALEVRGGSLTAEPPAPVAHFAVPAARWWEDIIFT